MHNLLRNAITFSKVILVPMFFKDQHTLIIAMSLFRKLNFQVLLIEKTVDLNINLILVRAECVRCPWLLAET